MMLSVSKNELLGMYTNMLRIRRFEEKVGLLFSQGQIPGFVHLYIGEEAIAVGICSVLRKDDYIVSTHRGHGHVIAKGGQFNPMMAELFGKKTGYCKGKGGSMHIADFEIGMLGACGIVGGGIPIAVGAGLSAKYRGTDQVAVSFFGDGASNEGSFHESVNLAAALNLPVIFVCENNFYGEFTPTRRASRNINIADRAIGYGIPGISVDGTDVIKVYETVKPLIADVRNGKGPILIEAKTHRKGGHSEGEFAFLGGQLYRDEQEIKDATENDPVMKLHSYLLNNRIVESGDLENIDKEIIVAVDESVEFARNSPVLSQDSIYEDTLV